MDDVALADKTATSAPLATTCATPATIRRPRCPSLCAYAPAPLPPLLAPLDPYYLADEVRNYLFGSDAAQFECYRRWAIETGAPALKGLLPHVGGEVVGFWVATDACPEPELEGSEVEACTPTNVTWVIRWPSKACRDAGWDVVDSSAEYGAAKAKRKQICAAAGFEDGAAYRHVEVKFCVDVPTIAWQPPGGSPLS